MRFGAATRPVRGLMIGLFLAVALAGARQGTAAPAADAPYVPTPDHVVDAMLELGRVGPADYLVDLGCGDGRIVITAAKKLGARGMGVDLDSGLVATARRAAEREGVAGRVSFQANDLFHTDISRATVVTMYLLQSVNLRLRPRLLKELKPGTRIISHDFDLERWQPDARLTVPVPDKVYGPPSSELFLWVVPADASGVWRWQLEVGGAAREYILSLQQEFQMLGGSMMATGRSAAVTGRMRGEEIGFVLTLDIDGRPLRHEFSGRVSGNAIAGWVTVAGGPRLEWRATRASRGRMDTGTGEIGVRVTFQGHDRRVLPAGASLKSYSDPIY